MIITVKKKLNKRFIVKLLSVIALIIMFVMYYFHMKEKAEKELRQKELIKIEKKERIEKENRKKIIEKIIYKEVKNAVNLIGQLNVKSIRIISNKILIVCDIGTNINPLLVRYGSLALVKKTKNNIKIALDLKYIVKSNYNE